MQVDLDLDEYRVSRTLVVRCAGRLYRATVSEHNLESVHVDYATATLGLVIFVNDRVTFPETETPVVATHQTQQRSRILLDE